MKNFLILLLAMFYTQGLVFAQWYKLDDDMYLEDEKMYIKGNYLYLKYKFDNAKNINKDLKTESPGVLLDESVFSYMTQDIIVDCKKPRYKVLLTLIYGKNSNIINKIKNNTWEFDLTKSTWNTYCGIYDRIKKIKGE